MTDFAFMPSTECFTIGEASQERLGDIRAVLLRALGSDGFTEDD